MAPTQTGFDLQSSVRLILCKMDAVLWQGWDQLHHKPRISYLWGIYDFSDSSIGQPYTMFPIWILGTLQLVRVSNKAKSDRCKPTDKIFLVEDRFYPIHSEVGQIAA